MKVFPVLILVVMEEGQRLPEAETVLVGQTVLILVVMEEGQRLMNLLAALTSRKS